MYKKIILLIIYLSFLLLAIVSWFTFHSTRVAVCVFTGLFAGFSLYRDFTDKNTEFPFVYGLINGIAFTLFLFSLILCLLYRN